MVKKLVYFLIALVVIGVSACNSTQKIIKKGTPDQKFELAQKLYDKGDYVRCIQIYDELMVLFRGTPKIEQVYYNYAYAHYKQKEYVMASYHFKYYAKTFPNGSKAEECLYMSALCKYYDSPSYKLDQSSTDDAIKEMQLFINLYPNSPRVGEANRIIDELRLKLTIKDFEKAKMYYYTENYKAASYAFEQHLRDFPSTVYKEEAMYYIIKSNFEYSKKSVANKQAERYQYVIAAYNKYREKYPEGKFEKAALKIFKETQQELFKLENNESKTKK
jgi:outer membrane protein assembly factor BamD